MRVVKVNVHLRIVGDAVHCLEEIGSINVVVLVGIFAEVREGGLHRLQLLLHLRSVGTSVVVYAEPHTSHTHKGKCQH